MTITNSSSRIAYTGNGATLAFSFPYAFDAQTDLAAIFTVIATGVETTQVLNSAYTISGTTDALGRYPSGGTLTFVTAPPSTATLTIYRDPDAVQELNLAESGILPAESVEAELDYLTMLAQRARSLIDRSLRISDGSSASFNTLPSAVDRASKFLSFDTNGQPTVSAQVNSGTMTFTPVTSLFSGDDATVAFTLPVTPGSSNGSVVAISGVVQRPSTDYSITGTTLTFTTAPITGTSNVAVQIFSYAQAVPTSDSILANGSITSRTLQTRFADIVNVLDYGADKTGVADSTAAFQAVALIPGTEVWIPEGTYKITDTIEWKLDGTHVRGAGVNATTINFQPTAANKVCFKWGKGGSGNASIQVMCGFSHIGFSASGNTQPGKVAIQITTNEEFWATDFRITSWTGTGTDTVGLQLYGWQLMTFRNMHIYAETPVDVKRNPWGNTIIQLDLDGCLFEQGIWAPDPVNPCLRIEDGAFITNSIFRNIYFVGGAHGVEWIDLPRTITNVVNNGSGLCRVTSTAHGFETGRFVQLYNVNGTIEANIRSAATVIDANTFDLVSPTFVNAYVSGGVAYRSPGNSYQLQFLGCRIEQRSDTSKYNYYFDRQGSPLETVQWVNCYMDSTANGIYLRRTQNAKFTNCTMTQTGGKETINTRPQEASALTFDACSMGTGTPAAKIVNMRQTMALGKPANAQQIASTCHYVFDGNTNASDISIEEVLRQTYKVTLVDDETFNLQCGSGASYTQAHITVSAHGATLDEGMICFAATGTNVFRIAGTANTAVADTDTDICVYRSGSNILLRNRLGETAEFLIVVDGRFAQDISATNMYLTEGTAINTPINLTDIVITDAVSTNVIFTIFLSAVTSGTLNTATAGASTSTYNRTTGLWVAEGTVANVNTLLAGLIMTPTTGFTGNVSLHTRVVNPKLQWVGGVKVITVT